MIKHVLRILYFSLCFFLAINLQAKEAFVIDFYKVYVDIHADGSVDITEELNLDFKEARRGLYRDIPLGYKNKSASDGNAIVIENISVDGLPFQLINKSGLLRLKIGDPRKKIRGEKKLIIKYTVYGIVEHFDDFAEFSWNLIGDRWNTTIEKSEFMIKYPFPLTDNIKDVLWASGRNKSTENNISHSFGNNNISAKMTKKLRANEGVSLALRFRNHDFPSNSIPTRLLADKFYVESSTINVFVKQSAEVVINEAHQLKMLENTNVLTREIYDPYFVREENDLFPVVDSLDVLEIQNYKHINLSREGDRNVIRIDHSNNKEYVALNINYSIEGNMFPNVNNHTLFVDLANFSGNVPVDKIQLTLNNESGITFGKLVDNAKGLSLLSRDNSQGAVTLVFERKGRSSTPLWMKIDVIGLDKQKTQLSSNVYYRQFIASKGAIEIVLLNDNLLRIKESLTINKKIGFNANSELFQLLKPSKNLQTNFKFDSESFLNKNPTFSFDLISDSEEGLIKATREKIYFPYFNSENNSSQDVVIEYEINNPLVQSSDNTKLLIPLFAYADMPFTNIDIKVKNNEGLVVYETVNLSSSNRNYSENNANLVSNSKEKYLALSIPKQSAYGMSFLTSLKNKFTKNKKLLMSFLTSFLFYLLWRRYGKDQVWDGSATPYPPLQLTPAEAGYLWDKKIHGRDLISLIYYWAAEGLILIVEIGKDEIEDYELIKIKDLPADAFSYEKTFYEGLFADDLNSIRIKSLNEKMYKTMRKSYKHLKKDFNQKHLFEPYTRGLGIVGIVVGALIIVFACILLGFKYSTGDLTSPVSIFIIGLAVLFFGIFLPKKSAVGSKYFIELQKFNSFINIASVEELQKLYDKDSEYFQNTIAYAIVLGKAKKWAKGFEGILKKAPDYYQSRNSYHSFSPILFTNNVTDSMHTMEKTFYSTPTPEYSTGSPSYDGGSSSSFGGGFSSGGGFGGGGGSSW